MPKNSTPDFAICQRLTQWRKAQGLTMSELSRTLNLSPNAWKHYESGKALPQAGKLALLAQHYKVDLNFIFTGTTYQPPTSTLAQATTMAVRFLQQALDKEAAQAQPHQSPHQPPTHSLMQQPTTYQPTTQQGQTQEARPKPQARPFVIAKALQTTRG